MKKLVSLILALTMMFSISVAAYAETTAQSEKSAATAITPIDTPRAEETCWYFRTTDDGLFQKRLWSITYRKWLTDWITVGYVNP